jgi:hypothetical protein
MLCFSGDGSSPWWRDTTFGAGLFSKTVVRQSIGEPAAGPELPGSNGWFGGRIGRPIPDDGGDVSPCRCGGCRAGVDSGHSRFARRRGNASSSGHRFRQLENRSRFGPKSGQHDGGGYDSLARSSVSGSGAGTTRRLMVLAHGLLCRIHARLVTKTKHYLDRRITNFYCLGPFGRMNL